MLEYERFSPGGIVTMDTKTLDPTVNDTDMDEEILIVDTLTITQMMDAIHTPAIPSQRMRISCHGILLAVPPGQNEHLSYPFTLHSERTLPWNYWSINGEFFLQAKSCQKKTQKG